MSNMFDWLTEGNDDDEMPVVVLPADKWREKVAANFDYGELPAVANAAWFVMEGVVYMKGQEAMAS